MTLGIVENIDDPTCSGRVKVRIKGYHDNIPTEQLPWCSFGGSAINSERGGGQLSVARVGQQVRVRFNTASNGAVSMEWYGVNQLDPNMISELANDYEGSHFLLYDSAKDLSIKFQPNSGLTLNYAGSYINIAPDNTMTLHYGLGNSGTNIQLSEGKINIQAPDSINLSTSGTINMEADNIVLNAKQSVQIKGNTDGECAVNGTKLMTALLMLANAIDMKVPQSAGMTATYVNALKESIINQNIQYI